jgi:serine/threonine protein kinase
MLKSFYENDLISINDLLDFNFLALQNQNNNQIELFSNNRILPLLEDNNNDIISVFDPTVNSTDSTTMIKNQTTKLSIPEHFQASCVLGRGDFGKVYKVQHQIDGQHYALKKMHFHQDNQSDIEYCLNEIQVLARLQHPNIVRYHCSFFEIDNLYIQTELCDITLSDAMLHSLKLSRKAKYIFEILNGLHYLHQLQYIHFDMKPDNILIKNGVCKIADFGFTKLKKYCVGNDDIGCNIYSPPFLSHSSPYVDIYSLGVITIELFLEERYVTNMEKILVMQDVIYHRNFKRLKGESKFNRLLEKFLTMCFYPQTNTSELMNFYYLLNRKYFSK